MDSLTLHPVPRREGWHYWLGNYPLYLLGEKRGWHGYTPVSCTPVLEWLQDTGLVNQYFASRREAVEIFSLALADDKAPSADVLPNLVRRPGGRYRLGNRFLIFKSQGCWTVGDSKGSLRAMVAGSLWCAGWVAFYHDLKTKAPQDNRRPLIGFTHQEISLQRLLLDGADRPSWANNFMNLKQP